MIEHRLQKALATYINTLGVGWNAVHSASALTQVRPLVVVVTASDERKGRSHSFDFDILIRYMPDDTGDDTAHDKAEIVRAGFDSRGAAATAINSAVNAYGIDVNWLAVIGGGMQVEGERERAIRVSVRVAARTAA